MKLPFQHRKTGICRYAKECRYYTDNATCNNDYEAVENGYCGIAREFKKFENANKIKYN